MKHFRPGWGLICTSVFPIAFGVTPKVELLFPLLRSPVDFYDCWAAQELNRKAIICYNPTVAKTSTSTTPRCFCTLYHRNLVIYLVLPINTIPSQPCICRSQILNCFIGTAGVVKKKKIASLTPGFLEWLVIVIPKCGVSPSDIWPCGAIHVYLMERICFTFISFAFLFSPGSVSYTGHFHSSDNSSLGTIWMLKEVCETMQWFGNSFSRSPAIELTS